jgi:uncharacterized repeat protein (TIGR03803 family)
VKNFTRTSRRAAFRVCRATTCGVVAIGALLFASTSDGQPTYEVLSTFDAGHHGSVSPYDELIQARDGNFYGTTLGGGASGLGTIFKMDGARRITTIHSFTGSDGATPRAGLVEGRDGQFYGATFEGGAFNVGTIFKVTAAGNLTIIRHLSGPDGSFPEAALIQARDGNLYGVTGGGGAFNDGTAFKIDVAGTLTTIHDFQGADGSGPSGRLFEARDGSFYGTTAGGTIFTMDPDGRLTTLHTSTEGDFFSFVGVIQASDGSLYGTTATGGSGVGTVFRIDAAGTFSTIHQFSATDLDGAFPRARLMQASDGRLFGTTNSGGLGFGTIFTINAQGAIATVHYFTSFSAHDGGHPNAGLIEATDGNLYGVAISGGSGNAGVVYRVNVAAQRRSPTADTYVRAGASASTNFGAVSTLLVKKGVSADNTSRCYLTFDVGDLGEFSQATLRVYGRVASVATPAVDVTVYAVNDTTWGERTVTWNARPDLGAVLGRLSVVGTTPRWLEFDISAFVRAQRAAGADAVAFALRSLTHTSAEAVFNSKDAATGQPQLIIRR